MNSHCDLCPRKNRLLQPSGHTGARMFAVGEAPGLRENESGEVFIGPSGQELNRGYLPLGGVYRDNLCIVNAICCFPDTYKGKLKSDRQQDIDLLNTCFNHNTAPLLLAAKPEIVLALGGFACRALDPTIELDMDHGIPRWSERFKCWIFPMYHPALGMYEPKKMLHIRNDWVRLKKFRHKKLPFRVDPYAGWEDYQHVDADGVTATLEGQEEFTIAVDTETTKRRQPFCLTYSTQPGTGYLIRADDAEALERFQYFLDRWHGKILFHNYLFDGKVCKGMGLRMPQKLIEDTMVKVFNIGNLPQGLKALCRRELGAQMQDFEDLVKPHSRKLVLDYFMDVWSEEWEKPPSQMVVQKDGELKKYQPQSVKQKLKRFYTDFKKNPEKDPFKMWNENWVDLQDEIESRCGEFPGMCITHAPFEQVIHYSCRDADTTLRLNPILNGMINRVRKTKQENWGDR